MRKSLMFAAAAALFASPAMADTVQIVSKTQMIEPSGAFESSHQYPFVGTMDIVLEVAGKKCTLNGSARGSVPMGCNYTITVQPNGSLSGELRAGNNVCTPTPQVASSCK